MQNRSSYIVLCLNSHVSNYRAVAHAQVALSIFIHEIEYVDLDKTCSHRLSHMWLVTKHVWVTIAFMCEFFITVTSDPASILCLYVCFIIDECCDALYIIPPYKVICI